MRASKTVAELLEEMPQVDDFVNMAKWFAECYKVAEINSYGEILETAWLGLHNMTDLDFRFTYRNILSGQLNALLDIETINKSEE